jgi:signal transduction histidine kinase
LPEFKRVAQATYTDVREAIFSLHTAGSSGLGLLATLQEYLVEYQEHYGLDTRLVVDSENLARFSPDVDIQLLRIIQEALSNVRKHAQANEAWVRFEQDDDCVCISVEDAGRGFDPTQLTGEGSQYFGLQIMRERAESVGASLDLDSRPGQGTRVVIRLPRSLGGRDV